MAARTLTVVISGDASSLDRALSGVERRTASFGTRMQSAGRRLSSFGSSMTRTVTTPILAAAGASLKFAVDFETAFTKIRANSNLSAEEIDRLRKVVLDLAGKTGKAPRELAEGLYFLASAGLTAAQVQETLTMSAKASAAGFGTVADVATLTANALNAYAKDGLTAAEVTDTLAAAVREGTAEPDAFASALGRILPVAQKAGIEFDEVTASLASLSTIGLDVNEGVTAMRGLLSALLSPGTQAKDTMREVGLSADQLRKSLADDGLIATMRLLEEATNGDIDALRKIVPNIRAMTGMFGLTGQEAKKVDAAFRNVIEANGDLDEAFNKTQKDSGFKFKRLLAELQTLAIQLGDTMLPVARKVVREIVRMVRWFSDLPKPVKETAIKIALLAAALGPLIRVIGGVIQIIGGLHRALMFLVAHPLVAVGVAVAALAVLIVANWDKIKEVTAKVFNWIKDFLSGIWSAIPEPIRTALGILGDAFARTFKIIVGVVRSAGNLIMGTLRSIVGTIEWATEKLRAIEGFVNGGSGLSNAVDSIHDAIGSSGGGSGSSGGSAVPTGKTPPSFQSSSGTTNVYNIYTDGTHDGAKVARVVLAEIEKNRKREARHERARAAA